jgi:DNA-binding YbaB/EbfC family protein
MMPGMPDLQSLLQHAQQMQADMAQAQADLAETELTGHAGGGLVSATVSGDGQLKSLSIDRSVVDPDDIETLADLIIAAVRDAGRAAAELTQEKMGSVAGGLAGPGGLEGAGLDLSAFGLTSIEVDDEDEDDDYEDGDDDDEDDDDEDDDEVADAPRELPRPEAR